MNVKNSIPEIILAIRYATDNNFTKKEVYTQAQCSLLEPIALALAGAAQDYVDLPQEILDNRKLLADAMSKHGFRVAFTEWWHFEHTQNKAAALLNILFEDLEKKSIAALSLNFA